MFKWRRLFLAIIIILLIIIVQARNINVESPFRGLLGNVVNPAIFLTNKVFSSIGNIWNSYINLINVQQENKEYKKLIDNLTLENALLSEKLSQSERLETLLRLYRTYDFKQMPANVIGVSDGYVKNIVIDAGDIDGVEKNAPVIGFQGLVGRVSNTYATTSEVDVILNISSNVSVMNSRTRVSGIMRGDGEGRLYVDYYDRLDDVRVGDVFVTSGLGMLYPKGIRIGKVSDIVSDNTGLFQKVFIEQSEDFYKLEHVFVVKSNSK